MQGIKLYGFYGLTMPMILTMDRKIVDSVLSSVSNGYSARLLINLISEGEMLRHSLYHSGRFRYIEAEESTQAKKLIRYIDFAIAYKARVEGTSTAASSKPIDVNLEDLLNNPVNVSGDALLQSAIQLDDLGVNKEGLDDLESSNPTLFPSLDLSILEADSTELTTAFSDDFGGFSGEDLLASEALDPKLLATELGTEFAVSENQSLELIDLSASNLTINQRILETLIYDAVFYSDFQNMNYEAVSQKIENWQPEKYTTLKSLRVDASNLKLFASERQQVENLNAIIAERELTAQTEFDKMRLENLILERDKLMQIVGKEDSEDSKYFTPELLKLLEEQRALIPKKLLPQYTTITGTTRNFEEWEYTLISNLHGVCSERIENQSALDYWLRRLAETRDKNVANSPEYFHTEFVRLAAIENSERIIQFNTKYRARLNAYNGADYLALVRQGIEDCDSLTNTQAISDTENLSTLFTMVRKDKKSDDPKGIVLLQAASLNRVVKSILSMPQLSSMLAVGTMPVSQEFLTSLLSRLIDTKKIIDLSKSVKGFVSLYRIWHVINYWDRSKVLSRLGVFEMPTTEQIVSIGGVMGIPGFFCDSILRFDQCCDIGLTVSNNKYTTIAPERNMHRNLLMMRRFLSSSEWRATHPVRTTTFAGGFVNL